MLVKVFCLDDGYGAGWLFDAVTPYEALQKCKYFLDLSKRDDSAKIELFGGGRTLSMVHNGKTYCSWNGRKGENNGNAG